MTTNYEKDTSIYSRERVSSIAPTIYSALPEWINVNFENFTEFLNYYYKFLATESEIDLVLNNLASNKSAAVTDDSLIDQLYNEFAEYIPNGHPNEEFTPTRRELLLKIVSTFYNSRGTTESAKKFFSFFYNDHSAQVTPFKVEDFNINLFNDIDDNRSIAKLWEPYTYVIRTTANTDEWIEPYIKIIHPIGYYLIALIVHTTIAGQKTDKSGSVIAKPHELMWPNLMHNPLNWRGLERVEWDFYWDFYKYFSPNGLCLNYATLTSDSLPIDFEKISNYSGNPFQRRNEIPLIIDNSTINVGEDSITYTEYYDERVDSFIWHRQINPTYGGDHTPTMQAGLLKRITVADPPQISIIPLSDPVTEGEEGAFVITITDSDGLPHIYKDGDDNPIQLNITYDVFESEPGAVVQSNWNDSTTWNSTKTYGGEPQQERAVNVVNPSEAWGESFLMSQGFWADTTESPTSPSNENIWDDDAIIAFDDGGFTATGNLPRYDLSLIGGVAIIPAGESSSYNGTIQEATDDFNAYLLGATLPTGIFTFNTFVNQTSYKDKTFVVRARVVLFSADINFELNAEAYKTFTINNITEFPPIPADAELFKTESFI